VQFRLDLMLVDDSEVLSAKYHRSAVYPGGDVQAQTDAVSVHLAAMGYPAMSAGDVQRITDHANLAWTPEVISAYAALLAQQ
jgi:hypothetical protein